MTTRKTGPGVTASLRPLETYVKTQKIPHGVICDWSERYTAPYVGLWALEDPEDLEFVGHWILAGDSTGGQPQPVPFDHQGETTEPSSAVTSLVGG
ncbi:DUF4826 family protein [Alishewanella tabrizica]|uniref:DUF4826 family protein n=1 Tax=Alishewanella tabrizica TaxID=671278 RepID=UPI001E2B6FA5|nr:DUF4826 family protein [Alishewanella tabrizica]